MTDHKDEATYHGGELPRRTPMEHLAAWGAPPEPTDLGPAPWGSLSQDIGHEAPRPAINRLAKLALVSSLVAIVLAVAAVVLQHSNLLPAGVPLVGKDSGLAACEGLQHGTAPVGGGTKASTADLMKARAQFADSRYPAIRDNGVRLMDVSMQIAALGTDPGLGALAYLSAFSDAYAGLAGGCAAVGRPIPPLTSK